MSIESLLKWMLSATSITPSSTYWLWKKTIKCPASLRLYLISSNRLINLILIKPVFRVWAVWSGPLLLMSWKVPYLNLLQANFQVFGLSLYLRILVWVLVCQKPQRQTMSLWGPFNIFRLYNYSIWMSTTNSQDKRWSLSSSWMLLNMYHV